jgi:hypothetical protein
MFRVHRDTFTCLRKLVGLNWRKAPAYTTNRGILQQLDAASVEKVSRDDVAAPRYTLDHDDFGLNRSKVMSETSDISDVAHNVIDTLKLERDLRRENRIHFSASRSGACGLQCCHPQRDGHSSGKTNPLIRSRLSVNRCRRAPRSCPKAVAPIYRHERCLTAWQVAI